MINPYEPPKIKPKYKPSIVDWYALGVIITVFFVCFIIMFSYFFLLGVVVRWLS